MFIYFSGKTFPSTTADHVYIRFLAGAFARKLSTGFKLAINGVPTEELSGIPTFSVPAPRHGRTIFYFFWLPRFVRRQGYAGSETTFFSNDLFFLVTLIFWKKTLGWNCRIISDWHLLTGTWRDRFVARGSDICITTSERLREQLIARTGVSAWRVQAVYGGVDVKAYDGTIGPSKRESLGLPLDTRLVGYVGRFKTMGLEKGLLLMLDALADMPSDVTMVFVGGSTEEIGEYRAKAQEKGVGDRCVWIVQQPFSEVVRYEKAVDVLVIPYPDTPHFRDFGFPMKVYEYIASGTPIVYSRLAIMEEILSGKAISFAPDDPRDLSRAIREALTVEARSVALLNREHADAYSWDEKASGILAAL